MVIIVNKSNNKSNKKQPMCRRTKFTILSMFNIVWYAIVVIIASFKDHVVPSELTVAWFSAWTVELALLYGIKINNKNTSNDNSTSNIINNYNSDNSSSNDSGYCTVQNTEDISDYDEDGLG